MLLLVTLDPGVTAVTKLGSALLISGMLGCSLGLGAFIISCRAVAIDCATEDIDGAEGEERTEGPVGKGSAAEDAAAESPTSEADQRGGTPNVCSGP